MRLVLTLSGILVWAALLAFGVGSRDVTLVFGALAITSIATVWRSTGIAPTGRDFATRLSKEVAQGKRLALYDHDTGLLAHWYFSMRFAEECDRATRYGGSFSIILLDADRSVEEKEDLLLDWMRRNKRSTDLVGCYSAGHYLMLLPQTDRVGADLALRRLQHDVPIRGSVAEFPHDGASPAELQGAAASRLLVERAA